MVEPAQLLAYSLALAIATAIPGPAVTALVARTVSVGAVSASAMLGGLMIGDFAYLSFAVFGMSTIIERFSVMITVIKWLSVAYLLLLAWQFWRVSHRTVELRVMAASCRSLLSASLSGFTLTLANPKTIAFYIALLPLVVQLDRITVHSWLFMLVPLTVMVRLVVGGSVIAGAHGVRRHLRGEVAQQTLRRAAAIAMAAAAGSMVLREL